MKLCSRTVTDLMRSWSFRSRQQMHSSFVTSEGVDNVDDYEAGDNEIERGVLRTLMKEFAVSTTIRNVAREHLLTGIKTLSQA